MEQDTAAFGTAFSQMFVDRISNPAIFAPLESLELYQNKMQAYDTAHTALFDGLDQSGKTRAQALLNALYGIQDMQMEFIYRLGMQEGIHLFHADFLIEGVGR